MVDIIETYPSFNTAQSLAYGYIVRLRVCIEIDLDSNMFKLMVGMTKCEQTVCRKKIRIYPIFNAVLLPNSYLKCEFLGESLDSLIQWSYYLKWLPNNLRIM